jgi:hypothetical protein
MALSQEQFTEQLEALEGKLRTSMIYPRTQAVTPKVWERIFRDLAPLDVYTRLASASGGRNNLKLEVDLFDNPAFANIMIRHNCPFDSKRSYMGFTVNADHTANLNHAFLKKDEQGKDVVKHYLGAMTSLLQDSGVEKLEIGTRNIGGYAWVQYGFCPDTKPRWENLKEQLKGHMNADKTQIRFQGKNYPLMPEEVQEIQKAMNANVAQLPTLLPQLTMLGRKLCAFEGHDISVGKALLIGTQWSGSLPLAAGHPSYERFCAYTSTGREECVAIGG